MDKICKRCKRVYPADLFERFSDECISCMPEPFNQVPQIREYSEWREMGTINRINDKFMRAAKGKR